MLDKRVYPSWAYTDHWEDKMYVNKTIFSELKGKYKILYQRELESMPKDEYENLLKTKAVITPGATGYAHKDYYVKSNPNNLSEAELALICDGGNLCYGYRSCGNTITIHTD